MINFYNAKKFCKDDISLVENFEKAIADSNQTWECHHRRETLVSKKELLENNEYYNRPASELIFLTKKEHRALHHKNKYVSDETKLKISEANKGIKRKPFTEEHKRKLSEAKKGNKYMLGKHLPEETKLKMSIAKRNMSEETKLKMSIAKQGRRWFNNGIKSVQAKSCPEGFVRGRLKK